jgi:uracil-DNA glycosylase family 4
MNAQKKLRVLRDAWSGCTKCSLAKLREGTPPLFGAGPAKSDFLLLVEAPLKEDTEEGVILGSVGGRLIEDLLIEAGIDPVKNVFRTSIVACRPYVVLPATEDMEERIQDRSADKSEADACFPRVQEIIYLVDPYLIIAMGDTPWKMLVSTKARGHATTAVTAAGNLYETQIPGRVRPLRYPVLATLSPAQLVANPAASEHGPIATTLAAFMRAAKYVNTVKKEERT